MSKDPAFLFYPNDYIGGTMGMTFEEKGAYMELLMMQFNRGHMSGHMISQMVGQLWETIKVKFIQDENGLWYNQRLDLEKEKRQAFTASRRKNIEGKNQHTKNKEHKGGHMTSHMEGHMKGHMKGHMENENEDVNKDAIKDEVNKSKIEKTKYKEVPDDFVPAVKMWIEYKKERKESYKGPKSFNAMVDKLILYSDNNPDIAMQIIKHSMSNNYSGFFELKQSTKQPQTQTPELPKFGPASNGTFNTIEQWKVDKGISTSEK